MGYLVTARAAAAMPNGESLPFAHMTKALQTHAPTEMRHGS